MTPPGGLLRSPRRTGRAAARRNARAGTGRKTPSGCAWRTQLAPPHCGPGGGCDGAAGADGGCAWRTPPPLQAASRRGLVVAPPRALRSPARTRQSLQTRRDRSAASPPRTGMASRHLGVIGAPGAGHRRLFQAPDRDCAHAQRRDSPRLALQCTTGRWACERYGGRHRGQRGFVGAGGWLRADPTCHHHLLIGPNPEELTAAPARPGSAETPAPGADCCHTAGRAGLRLAAPAADAASLAAATGRSPSPRPAWFLLAAGPGAGAATEPGTWRHCQAHRSPCAADTPAGIPAGKRAPRQTSRPQVLISDYTGPATATFRGGLRRHRGVARPADRHELPHALRRLPDDLPAAHR